MIIQLDGYFSFERIKEALLSALPTTRYYEWVYDTIQTTCLENEKMTKCIGIRAHLVYKHKKFWLLGDEVFEAGNLHLTLTPIPDNYPHSEVEITPLFEYQLNKEGSVVYTCEDPDNPNFKKALPIWKDFLENLKLELLDLP